METHPFFSIVIPVYNVAPYLCECLDSVQAQTFGNWEALCVDDGSTDASASILDKYAAKDARFRVVHQANAGVSAARNAALDRAEGEWLCFLDADDRVECNWLHDIAEGARHHPEADWIRTSYRDWFEGSEPEPWPDGHVCKYDEFVQSDVLSSCWTMLANSAMLVLNSLKREKLASIRFQEGLAYCEDSCFILDFVQLTRPRALLTIPNDDYRYRMRSSSASHSMNCSDVTRSLDELMTRWCRIRGRRGVFSSAIDRYYFRCIRSGRPMTAREASQCRRFLWTAFRLGFFRPWRFRARSKRTRWLFFMLFGNPRILTEKAGWRWFVRKETEE